MISKQTEESLLRHLVVCVTFYYKPERLSFLTTIISNYIGIAKITDIYIITNIANTKPVYDAIPPLPSQMSIKFVTPSGIGHPYLLPFTHREIFHRALNSNECSHFLYSEDDLLFSRSNVKYWLRYRGPLQKHGFIPSFFRVELHQERGWVSVDHRRPVRLYRQPKLTLEDGTLFICMPNPYQGMYFLDRQLMEEFANSPAMSPDFAKWNIREKAAQGLTFVNIPKGYTSRNLVPIDPRTSTIFQEAWIHHLPNNYANNQNSKFGKLPMREGGLFLNNFETRLVQFLSKVKHILRDRW